MVCERRHTQVCGSTLRWLQPYVMLSAPWLTGRSDGRPSKRLRQTDVVGVRKGYHKFGVGLITLSHAFIIAGSDPSTGVRTSNVRTIAPVLPTHIRR